MGSQNVLEVNEPVLMVRPDDGSIGPKHVASYVPLMVIIDVLDENINTLYKIWNTLGQIKLRNLALEIHFTFVVSDIHVSLTCNS